MIFPANLKKGDRIAIISPSSPVKEEYVDGAAKFLAAEGFDPVVMSYAKGPASGSYAATAENRLKDFKTAWSDDSIRAVLCSRGGYGAVHLLGEISPEFLRSNPKWLMGYSDISALHAMLFSAGIASIHSPMAKHLTEEGAKDPAVEVIMRILRGEFPIEYEVAAHQYNRGGIAEGRLVGGNLAVLNGLFGSRFDILKEDTILFIEDISEAIYAVERMLYHILYSGGFEKIKGLIIGRFTEYREDKNYKDMEEMIHSFLEREKITGMPIAFDFPVGHIRENLPIVEGAWSELTVGREAVKVKMKKR